MTKIAISKTEYEKLQEIKQKYHTIKKMVGLDIFERPTTKDTKKIITEFKATGLYNEEFLKSLEKGLVESPYFSK